MINSRLISARTLFTVIPAAILFGGAIELIQPYVGREGEWADFVADVIGIGCGVVLGLTIRAIRLKRAKDRGPWNLGFPELFFFEVIGFRYDQNRLKLRPPG